MADLLPTDVDGIVRNIPSGTDPFAYIFDFTASRFSLTFTNDTIIALIVMLFFHSTVVVFCLFLLIKSCISGTQQARWLFKRLYINDSQGNKAYNCPLYFLNAGIVVSMTQMLSSTAAGVYICLLLKSVKYPTSSVDVPILPALGVMCICESLSHWSIIHCFLVTIYASRGFHQKIRSGILAWISPPMIVNLLFFGIPFVATIAVAILFYWLTVSHTHAAEEVTKLLDILKQSSLAWRQLNGKPQPSEEETARLTIQLLQTIPNLKNIYNEIILRTDYFLYAFNRTQLTLIPIDSLVCLDFIAVFYILFHRCKQNDEQSDSNCALDLPRGSASLQSLKPRRQIVASRTYYQAKNRSFFRTLKANKKLVNLVIRALAIFLSMMSQLATCCLFAIKTREIILDEKLWGLAHCIVILSGTWSSIPIAWQCWTLYADQTQNEPPQTSHKRPTLTPKRPMKFKDTVELEIEREKELQMLSVDVDRDHLDKYLEIKLEKNESSPGKA